MNEKWMFCKGDTVKGSWKPVTIPHTWNVADVMDEEPGYYRGDGWYKRSFTIPAKLKNSEISLYFEGVNQTADIFINGKKAGAHTGGYTGFSVPVTKLVQINGSNELVVRVNNSFNENIPPLTADFTFYGGIYRDVFLVASNRVHFDKSDYGSNGIYITTPQVSGKEARVSITTRIAAADHQGSSFRIVHTLYDPSGKLITSKMVSVNVKDKNLSIMNQSLPSILNPKLWSPEKPDRYLLRSVITDQKGKIIDEQKNYIGLRWFHFDAQKGFYLNGKSYKLMGASRHQDYKGLGNAVPDSLAVHDVYLLKNMGANFLRVAHYPQDPAVLNACDSLGLLASVEIPIVNEITETDSFRHNSETMLEEMIKQNVNHPSVIMWCYMNEILLKPHFSADKARQEKYIASIHSLAQALEDRTRALDPSRYTMMADHGNLSQYEHAGLITIPQVIGWNLYSGWYGGSLNEFPKFLDTFHRHYPDIPVIVSEFGADADPRIRSNNPVRFDKSVDYTTLFHQFYYREIMKRPYVSGAAVWNLADFNSETRTETMPHINNKGLMEWDRTPKDPYYFYQAVLGKKPMVKLLGISQQVGGLKDSGNGQYSYPLKVATTSDSVEVIINNTPAQWMHTASGMAQGNIIVSKGQNHIRAESWKDGKYSMDSTSVYVHAERDSMPLFTSLNIIMGCSRYYISKDRQWWQPNHKYVNGGWGSVGGSDFKIKNNGRLPYGTDKDIIGTDDDPVYQTQLVGLNEYHVDVPAGTYEINLHFAELLGGKVPVPPYNLSSSDRLEDSTRRVFDVLVNGHPFLEHFNIADEKGTATALKKTFRVIVTGKEGIVIKFKPVEGQPVLNALQIRRINDTAEK